MSEMKKVALVTGAASGIGLACARQLARDGYHVAMVDLQFAALNTAAMQMRAEGCELSTLTADLGDLKQVEAIAERLGPLRSGLHVVVNNAAISPKRDGARIPLSDTTVEDWERTLRVNLTAPMLLTQMALPAMRSRKWGRIINISSMAGRAPSGLAGLCYTTTKTGLLGLTRATAQEVARDGITVNSVAPGRFATPMGQNLDAEAVARIAEAIPLGRWGSPSEAADLVSFLASEKSAYITGAVLDINGGLSMI